MELWIMLMAHANSFPFNWLREKRMIFLRLDSLSRMIRI